jgi:hypothetical protein
MRRARGLHEAAADVDRVRRPGRESEHGTGRMGVSEHLIRNIEHGACGLVERDQRGAWLAADVSSAA